MSLINTTTSNLLGYISFLFILISLPFSFWSVGRSRRSSIATLLIAGANLTLTSQLLIRWWESSHFPISNLYESLCFLAWSTTLAQLLAERAWPSPIVSAIATPISLLTIAFSSFALPAELQTASPLVPALRSSWLVMHVSVIMCSYAALLLGSLFSIAVLILPQRDKLQIRSSSIGIGSFRSGDINQGLSDSNQIDITPISLSEIEQLDSLSYRTITLGFFLLTLGLITGAVWANEAWGSWWSWDPKETWAFITWLVYAAYLHVRLIRGWQGRRPAIFATCGLFVILVCYIGVNLLGVGLHSYGWIF